jgi:hypothetical protein
MEVTPKHGWKWISLKLACAAAALFLVLCAVSYMAIDGRNSISGNTMRDLYAQERVDLLFLGSSTVYESCAPTVFESVMGGARGGGVEAGAGATAAGLLATDAGSGQSGGGGISAFNAATPAQTFRESYWQLREVCRLYKPKRVFLGVGPQHIMEAVERDSLSASYLFDNMKWSPVKAGFLADAFSIDRYPSALFPAVRLRDELTPADFAAAVEGHIADLKGSPEILESEELRYAGKGYVANLLAIENGTLPEAPPLGFAGGKSAAASSMGYLDKMVNYCKTNGIGLVLFQTPLLPGATEWIGDYAAYHGFLAGYARDEGIEFWDFNYLSPDIIAYEDDMFSDLEHATEGFAQDFSEVFAGLAVEHEEGKPVAAEKFFADYGTYRELYHAVASTWVESVSAGGVRVASVGTAEPEYRVAVLRDDGEWSKVYRSEWQVGAKFSLPALEAGDYTVTVEARPQDGEGIGTKGNSEELHVE